MNYLKLRIYRRHQAFPNDHSRTSIFPTLQIPFTDVFKINRNYYDLDFKNLDILNPSNKSQLTRDSDTTHATQDQVKLSVIGAF